MELNSAHMERWRATVHHIELVASLTWQQTSLLALMLSLERHLFTGPFQYL